MPKSLPNRKRLTDLAVARMGPGITWDTLVVGLGIRVGARTRTWIVAIKGAKRKVGTFPEMKVAAARAAARDFMEGGVKTPAGGTFHTIVEEFLQHGRTRKGRPLRKNSLDQYRRVFARYAKPLLSCEISQLSRRDIAELLRDVANESGATTASLVRSMLHRLWEYAMSVDDAITANPVARTPSYQVAKRSRVLTDGELAAIWAATEGGGLSTSSAGGGNATSSDYGLIVRLLLWTGCRRGEAGGARGSEFQDSNATLIWHLPPSRTKNGRPLALPLAKQTSDNIRSLPRIVGRDCLFGTWSARGFNGWSDAKKRLDAQLGFATDWDLHDCRRTCETRLIGLGVNREVVNRIMNHAMNPITAAYTHYSFESEMAEALQLWADELDRIVVKSAHQVISLRHHK